VTDLKLKVGKREFNLNDRPDNRGELVWEGEPGATMQILAGGNVKWHAKGEDLKDEWALFKLIASGNPQPSDERTYHCSWTYLVSVLGVEQTFLGDLTLEAEDRVNAFQKDFFTKFHVPDKVGP